MAVIVSVINQKGGVGKSTIAFNLDAGIRRKNKGKKNLLIDLDSQCSITMTSKANMTMPTIFEVLKKEIEIEKAIQDTNNTNIIPGSQNLVELDKVLSETGKEYRLRESIEKIKDNYDYIIIDTPPTLSVASINALTTSDYVLIPAMADTYSLAGIGQLYQTFLAVKKYCNNNLKIAGIVLNRFNPQTILSKQMATMVDDIAKQIETTVFETKLRDYTAIKEAQASRTNIFDYCATHNAIDDYTAFVNEFLKKIKK